MFFSIPVDEASQHILPSLGKGNNIPGQDFTESPYFSQTLKTDLDDITFPKGSTLLKHMGDLLLCSFSQILSQEDSIYLLELLV